MGPGGRQNGQPSEVAGLGSNYNAFGVVFRSALFNVLTAFSPDGQRLATTSGANLATGQTGNEVKIWDATTGLELATLRGPLASATSMAFTADGTKLLVIGSDIQMNRLLLEVWDATPSALG
jgi:WD40 repeat protein